MTIGEVLEILSKRFRAVPIILSKLKEVYRGKIYLLSRSAYRTRRNLHRLICTSMDHSGMAIIGTSPKT